ncbi:MAG: hypothetical protein R3B09_15925 [Nannocystaceae bacterium]
MSVRPAARDDEEIASSCIRFAAGEHVARDYTGPLVVAPEVTRRAEGSPLWVMTNADGVVRAAVGGRFE